MKKLGLFSLIMACFLYCPVMIMATPHYVSPTGKATWLQSTAIASPCSTAVAFANAQAGDTVYFRGGTYRTPKRNFGDSYSGYYCAAHSGTAASYIVFMAYPSEVPLFSGLTGGSADQACTLLFSRPITNRISFLMGLALKRIPEKKWPE
jgi:hypothetical protein